MSKNKKKKINNKTKEVKSTNKNRIPIINNVLVLFFFIILVFYLKSNQAGYKWLNDSLLQANLQVIYKNNNLSKEQKLESKLGFDYKYLSYIKENTPDSAIILLPPKEILTDSEAQQKLGKRIKNRVWCSYFLYPRKIIYADDNEEIINTFKPTHVGVINSWGYDKLSYNVNNKIRNTILPITQ